MQCHAMASHILWMVLGQLDRMQVLGKETELYVELSNGRIKCTASARLKVLYFEVRHICSLKKTKDFSK